MEKLKEFRILWRNRSTHPMAAETVLKSMYSIDSVETEVEGIELYRQLDSLWSLAMEADLELLKIISATPEDEHATQLSLNDGDHAVKTLGLSWESKDVLSIATAEVCQDLTLTKRNVLKRIAAMFEF